MKMENYYFERIISLRGELKKVYYTAICFELEKMIESYTEKVFLNIDNMLALKLGFDSWHRVDVNNTMICYFNNHCTFDDLDACDQVALVNANVNDLEKIYNYLNEWNTKWDN